MLRNLSPRDTWTNPLSRTWIPIDVEPFLLSFSVETSMYLTHLTAGYDACITSTGHEFMIQVEGRKTKQATQPSQELSTSYPQCPYQCMLQLAKSFSKSYEKSMFTKTDTMQMWKEQGEIVGCHHGLWLFVTTYSLISFFLPRTLPHDSNAERQKFFPGVTNLYLKVSTVFNTWT